ncbi:MAG: HAD-IIB family hydrolase [Erysipelotrichaceae bacterium]|nr:HAD-IIB family hydrolase [Erysipelotrichaceae bacterium]
MIDVVKAVVADIDGTLVNKGEAIMPVTKQALEILHEKGVLLGLSTGRKITQGMFQRAKDWGLSFQFDMMIGMNGGMLWDKDHNEIENYFLLKTDTMKEIIEKMSPLDLNVMIYEDEHMVTLRFDEMIEASMKRNHMKVIIADGDTDRLCVNDNYNVLFRFNPERTEEVAAFAKTIDCDRYQGIMTSPGIIEFMDPRVNKGMGLHQYSRRSGIPIENIMAFGDMDNDALMLKEAGWGICLLNGSDYSKSMADAITEYPCTEDGMGRYLMDHVLNK